MMPVQPSRAISRQSSREKPSGSAVSRSVRMRFSDERPATNSRAVCWRSSCSAERTRSTGGSVGETQDALGDDVQLDLRRPALDRVPPGAEPVAGHPDLLVLEPGSLPAERL